MWIKEFGCKRRTAALNKHQDQMVFFNKLHGVRGLAVLFVLLFHFFEKIFPGGFLGVDLFFLLSGFLVTNSALRDIGSNLEARRLNFLKNFYSKRAARILPMVLFSSSISLVAALLFSRADEVGVKISFFLSSIMGFTNLKLYKGASNYFSLDQDFNFFTQTWSLGIEEQFYFVFSMIVFACLIIKNSEKRMAWLRIVISASFLISLFFVLFSFKLERRADAIFYLLPFRWWELCLGVLVSLFFEKIKFRTLRPVVENLALLTMLLSLFVPFSTQLFPFPILLPIVMSGTYFLISAQVLCGSFAEKILHSRLLQMFGSISYSLYLIHWIVLVFVKYTFGLTVVHAIVGFFLSIGISYLTFLYIEKPSLHFFKKEKTKALVFLTITVLCMGIFYRLNKTTKFDSNRISLNNFVDIPEIASWGEELSCHGAKDMEQFEDPYSSCLKPSRKVDGQGNVQKAVFLTGDSHAAQMVFMVDEALREKNYELRYINTESKEDIYGFTFGDGNVVYKPKVFEYILKMSLRNDIVFLTFASSRMDNAPEAQLKEGLEIWKHYLDLLRKKGVLIVLVKDSPIFAKAPVEQCAIQGSLFHNMSACEMNRSLAREARLKQEAMFDFFGPIAKTFDLFPFFCDVDTCSMFQNGSLWYYDHSHYTKDVSLKIAPDLRKFLESSYGI